MHLLAVQEPPVRVERQHEQRAKHLARLMCPVCRGHEIEDGATADSIFELVDRDGNGVIQPAELMLHLLISGQEVETVSELFQVLDTDHDGVISRDEWHVGFDRFLRLAQKPEADAPAEKAPPVEGSTAEAAAAE